MGVHGAQPGASFWQAHGSPFQWIALDLPSISLRPFPLVLPLHPHYILRVPAHWAPCCILHCCYPEQTGEPLGSFTLEAAAMNRNSTVISTHVHWISLVFQSCKAEDGAHVFIAHNDPISCMQFSPFNPAHLLSVSNETLRCGDVTRAVFDEVSAPLVMLQAPWKPSGMCCCEVSVSSYPGCCLVVVLFMRKFRIPFPQGHVQ